MYRAIDCDRICSRINNKLQLVAVCGILMDLCRLHIQIEYAAEVNTVAIILQYDHQ